MIIKKLLLMRHANPYPSEAGHDDMLREIDAIGKQQASIMGERLRLLPIRFDCVISSPAQRATQTAEIICNTLKYDINAINIDPRIYFNTLDELLHVVHEIDPQHNTVLMVGHNPGFSQLSAYLSGDNSVQMNTCGSCLLSSERAEWRDINFQSATLEQIGYTEW